MRGSDIRAKSASVNFREVRLDQPLIISDRPINFFTIAEVTLEVETRSGRSAHGHGQSVLSVPWAWPNSVLTVQKRDEALRSLVHHFVRSALDSPTADPITTWRHLTADLDRLLHDTTAPEGDPVPRLAGLLSLGAVDSALHDAWGRAWGRSSLAMCSAEHLPEDLSWVDDSLRGVYPADALSAPERTLEIQHVVGVDDPLTAADNNQARTLEHWLSRDCPAHLKLKLAGADPSVDAQRVVAVYELASQYQDELTLALDPNEGYSRPAVAEELLEEIARRSPLAAAAVDYVEQPISRDTTLERGEMAALSRRVPVLLDEGFDRLSDLPKLLDQGWSGVVIKASKGQTPAMVAAAAARAHGMWCLVQDLTASSFALAHSARLVSALTLTRRHLEFNSRQFAPDSNAHFGEHYPSLVTVRDGTIRLPEDDDVGLYGFGNTHSTRETTL